MGKVSNFLYYTHNETVLMSEPSDHFYRYRLQLMLHFLCTAYNLEFVSI